ncbi:MAG TPA: HAMP domain-containing sensor histidine kinase [Aquihabitans sp.]|nr:HAMP domain-containing sensor histidine kinase [Aquihabitans sp.]
MRARRAIRFRIAMFVGAAAAVAGTAVLGLNYVLTARSLAGPGEVCISTTMGSPAAGAEADAAREAEALGAEPCADDADDPVPSAAPPGDDEVSVAIDGEDPLQFVAAERARRLRSLLAYSALALVGVCTTAVLAGWVVAGRALRPLGEVTATARRLSIDSLHQRIALAGPDDELKELADAFDAMLDRLSSAVASQQRFVADASHELRTPLAVVRTEVDVALADPDPSVPDLRSMAGRVRDAAIRSEQLVGSLLVLARSERDVALDDDLDLGELAAAAVAAASAEIDAAGLSVSTALRPTVVRGDRHLVESLVTNLVVNAVRHNVDGGTVRVATADGQIEVANTGHVIDADEVEALLEPFARGPAEAARTARTGHGLGLAIVRSVAHAHGATLSVEPLKRGGLRVRVEFSDR